MDIRKYLSEIILVLLIAVLCIVLYFRLTVPSYSKTKPSPSPILELTPSHTILSTPAPSPMPTPEQYADKPDIDITSWEYVLANKENPLSSDYYPELTALENGQHFDSRAVDALNCFIAGAREEGYSVYITSSFRSYLTQQYLFNNKVNQYISSEGSEEAAITKAKTIVANPGTSEHQLGLACDIVDKYYQYMDESLGNTELSKWMVANCAQYGFILRYPKGKTDITGVMYEPWHFRFVGAVAADYIMEKELSLEEFAEIYK